MPTVMIFWNKYGRAVTVGMQDPPSPNSLTDKLYSDLVCLWIHVWDGMGVSTRNVRPPWSKLKGLWSGCKSACQLTL